MFAVLAEAVTPPFTIHRLTPMQRSLAAFYRIHATLR